MTEQEKSVQPPKPTGNVFLDVLLLAEFNALHQKPVQHITPTSTEVVPRGYRTQKIVQEEEGTVNRKTENRKSQKRSSKKNPRPKK